MERLATLISAAVNMRTLYPANHPRVTGGVEQIAVALRNLMEKAREDSITYVLVGDDLVVGEEVIRKTTLPVREFVTLLNGRGIERLTLAAGVVIEELRALVEALATGQPLGSSGHHIIVGRARVVLDDEERAGDKHRELSSDQIEIVREAWAQFRVERKLPIDQLEELVWSLIDSVARTTRSMLPLAQLRAHDEYTFIHSVNVSLLVLALARTFGIWGPTLHAFGMAALLHDIGKLFTPVEILNKPGKLDPAEWEQMKLHAAEGAWALSEIEGAPPLAAVVAFEHHLRYDEQPNYPLLTATRTPNLASRMTAIADTYDAISTVRPYQEPMCRAAAFDLLKLRSGTFHDPVLTANFIRMLGTSAT